MSIRCKSLGAFALAAMFASPQMSFAQETGPIRIGALLSVTGSIAGVGLPERDGMMFAVDQLNKSGGINGRQIEVILEDDGSSPDSAIVKINKLIHEDKVTAIIGPSGIAQTVAVGAITQAAHVPLVAFTGIGPAVENDRTCVFHLTPAQALNARALLSYAKGIDAKRVAVLHDSGYGQVIWNAMQDMGPEFGLEFIQVEKFDIAATDATAQAAKIRAAKPDAVIVLSTSAVPFRNVKQVRIDVPIISVHGTATYQYVDAMGPAADGIVHAEFLIAEQPLPHQADFVSSFNEAKGHLPKHFEAAGFDALNIVAKALQAVPQGGEELCAALRQPYQGVMAKWDFSQPDLGGLTLESFNYSLLEQGQFKRLDFKAAE